MTMARARSTSLRTKTLALAHGMEPGTRRPLEGLTVVDVTTFLAGPYGTQILADLGARVLKVESPSGDLSRQIPPHFVHGDSVYFHAVNRSKQSLVLDLKKDRARELLDRILRKSDVLIDNYRPGVRDRLALNYERLSELNPRLIVCSITGFGNDAHSAAQRPAYDIVIQALSGGMSLTGEIGGRAVRAGIPLADLCGGMYAVIGILAALREREESGHGQEIDLSLLDCQVSMLTYQAAYYRLSGQVPGRQGRGHVSFPTYNTFEAADGREVVVAANTETMWAGLCGALELEHLIDNPRFATNPDRLAHRGELENLLAERFLECPAAHWIERLSAAGVPAALVNSVADALDDTMVRRRGMVIDIEHPRGGVVQVVGNPLKLRRTPAEQFAAPPALGGDSRRILLEFTDLGEDELERLRAQGVWNES